MYAFITVSLAVISIVSSLLLVVVILIQNNKGGGGIGAISGGMTETMFGAGASSALIKITVWLAAIFMGTTLLLATVKGRSRNAKSVAEKYAQEETVKVEPAKPVVKTETAKPVVKTESAKPVKTESAKPVEK
ncbi:MAG: preprotein translocase subunit SecG [Lentisphaeria bacterium]